MLGIGSYGVFAQSEGIGDSTILVNVDTDTTIRTLGLAAGGIFLGGTDILTINIAGVVDTSQSQANTAITTYSNGTSQVTALAGGVMRAGTNALQGSIDVINKGTMEMGGKQLGGVGGVIVNNGVNSAGASGKVAATKITGDFIQGGAGTLVADTDLITGKADIGGPSTSSRHGDQQVADRAERHRRRHPAPRPARDGYGTAVIQMITMTALWRQLPGSDAYAPLGLRRAVQAATPAPVPRDVEPTRRGPECPPDPPLAFGQSRPPIPCSDSATWISTSQFPDALLIQAGSRTIRMRYDVGRDGYVGNCRLEKSSGVPEVDKRLCKLMVRNAHYVPGRDGNGRTVGYGHTFEWGWTVTSRPRPTPAVPDAVGSESKELPATTHPDSPQSPENQGIEQPARQPKDAGTPGV